MCKKSLLTERDEKSTEKILHIAELSYIRRFVSINLLFINYAGFPKFYFFIIFISNHVH